MYLRIYHSNTTYIMYSTFFKQISHKAAILLLLNISLCVVQEYILVENGNFIVGKAIVKYYTNHSKNF